MKEELINALHTAVLQEAQSTACDHVRIHVDLEQLDAVGLETALKALENGSTALDNVGATVFAYSLNETDANVYESGYGVAVESKNGVVTAKVTSTGGVCPCCARRKWKAKAQQAFDNYPATEDARKFAAMMLSLMNRVDELEEEAQRC